MSVTETLPQPADVSRSAELPGLRRLAPILARPAIRRGLGLLAILVVFGLVLVTLRRFAGETSYDDVVSTMLAIPPQNLALAVLATAGSFAALIFYDVCALAYVGERRPLPLVGFVAFCAYAVGNTAGFGPLSGGAIRYRFYSRLGLKPEAIAKVIGFVTAAFGFGVLVCGLTAVLVAAPTVAAAFSAPVNLLRAVAVAGLGAVAIGYGFGYRRFRAGVSPRFRLPTPKLAAGQLLVTAVDLGFSALVLYALLPEGKPGFAAFMAIYTVAVASGVLSHVPGGLGVFETVILGALPAGVPADAALSSLLIYRIVYHVLPLLASTVLVAGAEGRRFARSPGARLTAEAAARVAPLVISTLSLVGGAMLVFSSVTPTPGSDLDFLADQLSIPLSVIEMAHFASGILGVFMIASARGIAQKLDGAWWCVTGTALAAMLLCFVKALAVFEAGLLLVLIASLWLTRRRFDRPASLFREALTGPWIFAIAVVLVAAAAVLFFAYEGVGYHHEIWIDFEFDSEAPRSLRAFLGIAVSAGGVALWSLLRTAQGRFAPPTPEELARAGGIVSAQDVADANIMRPGDKALLFSDAGDAFLMYGRYGRSWIAFLEPLGNRAAAPELVWKFVELAREAGGRSAFYQTSPWVLPLCADAGLQAIKLGETALVDLASFDLKGARRAGLRNTFNRCERDGLTFEFLETAEVPGVYDDLERISREWLHDKRAREKRFSVGWFDRDYVLSQPIAVLKLDGRIVAFANVLLTETRAEASIDLMRFGLAAPRSAMEFLLIKLMLHLRDQGYRSFNLGMAPLSGLVSGPAAPFWNRVGRIVFEHGERYYNFRGLRAFKSKFDPDWQPRYLAVSGGLSPALALADASQLIAGGLKGVVAK